MATKYTEQTLKEKVAISYSVAELLRNLGITKLSGGMHAHIKKRLKKLGIPTDHFKTSNEHLKINSFRRPKLTADEILVYNRRGDRRENKHRLRKAMEDKGIPYQCSVCDIKEWNGKALKLQIEHKDGDFLNNRIGNVCFICPNCHSQTPTYSKTMKNRI